jgi:hypothetical protein
MISLCQLNTCGNTIKYIATILSFMTIAVRSCNQSQYYSNNKKFVAENLFLATNLVDYGNKNFMWQYYSYIATIYKFGGSNTYYYNKKIMLQWDLWQKIDFLVVKGSLFCNDQFLCVPRPTTCTR